MRVVYYTIPPLLDVSLPFVAEISRRAAVHMMMQIHPGVWQSNMFDLEPTRLSSGVVPAAPVMDAFPPDVRSSWEECSSFHLSVFRGGHSLHPKSLRSAFQTARFIKRLKPDVVHLETTIGRLGPVLPLLGSMPLVMTVHDPEPHSGESPIKKILIRKLNFGLADHFILHNRSQISIFSDGYKISKEKIHITPLGVPDLYRQWATDTGIESKNTILFFGRISPYKGLEDLFDAIPIVCGEIPDAKFIIAGRPIPGYSIPPPPDLPGNIELIPDYISNTHMAELFRKANLVVCPYRDATQSAVVLTAYAFRKPVVATDVGGLPEYVDNGETGELVPPRNPRMLANGIVKILRQLSDEPQAREKYCQAINNKCNAELAWGRIAEKTIDIYQHAIK